MENEVYVRCGCGHEVLSIVNDEGDVDMAIYHYSPKSLSVWDKLRWMWLIIKGKPYSDQFVLNQFTLKQLIEALETMER